MHKRGRVRRARAIVQATAIVQDPTTFRVRTKGRTRNIVQPACLVCLCLLSLCNSAAAVEPTHRDVVYARVGERSLLLDIYQPEAAGASTGASTAGAEKSSPLVVWVHGGAWRGGSKDNIPVERWLSHGLAIASVDYRLSPEAKFPAQSHDIKAAIRFLRGHAATYRFDADRLAIAGSSAGGHLAALVGLSDGVKELEGTVGENLSESSRVGAIVSFFGAANLQSILSQSTEHGLSVRVPALQLLLGGQPDEVPELARLASPVAHVGLGDPPLWLIHGDADPQMPLEQSRELDARYAALGLKSHFEIIRGGKHGGGEFFQAERLDRLALELKEALELTAARGSKPAPDLQPARGLTAPPPIAK